MAGGEIGYTTWTLRLRTTPDAGAVVADALADRPDVSWVHLLSGGTEISCTGALGCLLQLGRPSVPGIAVGLAVTGAGVGLAGPAMGAAIAAAAPPGRAGMAAGILTTTRQFGQPVGVAVLGIAYQAGGLTPVYVVAAASGGVTGLLALVPRRPARVPA